jgi:hypothetical protein
MPTTEDATYPFWSPDSHYIGFFCSANSKRSPQTVGQILMIWPKGNVTLTGPDG